MTDDEVFDNYGDEPLIFSHYYNFVFVFKSAPLENGGRLYLKLGGNMEKVSAMAVDTEEPPTLNEIGDNDYAYMKDAENKLAWEHGEPI